VPAFWNGLLPETLNALAADGAFPTALGASLGFGSAWSMVFAMYAEAGSWRGVSLLESGVSWVFRSVSTCSIALESVQTTSTSVRPLTQSLFEQLHVAALGSTFLADFIVGAIMR
jgi:hypothetical protein